MKDNLKDWKLTNARIEGLGLTNPKTGKPAPYELPDPGCKGLFLRIEKSGVKTWWLYCYTPDSSGKRSRYRFKIGTFPTYRLFGKTPSKKEDRDRDVRRRARILQSQADTEDLRVTRQTAKAAAAADAVATLRNFIDGPYLPYCIETEMTEPEKTVRWLKAVFADLLDKRVDSINHWDIQTWITKAKKTRKPATIRRLLFGSLSSVLSLAIALGVIDKHPLQAKERNKKDTPIKLPKVENRKLRFLSADEETRLRAALAARDQRLKVKRANYIKHCQKRDGLTPPAPLDGAYGDYLTPLVLLALNTGIRRGGLLGLEWSDIDGHAIHVRPTIDKAGKGYSVVLSKEAKQVIRLWKHQSGGTGLVFPNARTGQVIRSIKTVWGNLMRDAKLENFRFHDCRHSFASKLVQAGVPLYTVQQLLGHSSIKMTERYSHLSPDHMKDALKALDA